MHRSPNPTVLELTHKQAKPEVPESRLPHILVIDDDFIIRDLVLSILSNKYRVDTLSSGLNLSEFLESHQPDLIILDVMLPWIHGFDIYRLLRSQENTKNTPLLFMSARVSEKNAFPKLDPARDGFLKKPFQKEELLREIQRLLA